MSQVNPYTRFKLFSLYTVDSKKKEGNEWLIYFGKLL